jgi:hypothetical protein
MLPSDGQPIRRRFAVSILVAVSARLTLFFGSMVLPIPNEKGLPISPLTANTALDLQYYQWIRNWYFSDHSFLLERFYHEFAHSQGAKFFLPGPLYPAFLHVFDYGPDNALPLSTLYLILSIALAVAWLWWLNRNRVGGFWLLVFAVFPTPFWFMLNVSTDLLFAASVGAFWLLWFNGHEKSMQRMVGITLVVVIAALLRPNALSLPLYLCIDLLIWGVALQASPQVRIRSIFFAVIVVTLTIPFAIFYLPYFYSISEAGATSSVGYFGLLPKQYLDGLWPDLPSVFDLGLSWLGLLAAKVFYLNGLRPSFGDAMTPLVFLRILPGIITLPGLIWLMFRASCQVRFFVVVFLVPVILGISQDRYILPIQPVLFFYGTKAWTEIGQLSLRVRKLIA